MGRVSIRARARGTLAVELEPGAGRRTLQTPALRFDELCEGCSWGRYWPWSCAWGGRWLGCACGCGGACEYTGVAWPLSGPREPSDSAEKPWWRPRGSPESIEADEGSVPVDMAAGGRRGAHRRARSRAGGRGERKGERAGEGERSGYDANTRRTNARTKVGAGEWRRLRAGGVQFNRLRRDDVRAARDQGRGLDSADERHESWLGGTRDAARTTSDGVSSGSLERVL